MIPATVSCNDYGWRDLTPQPADLFDSDAALADNEKLATFFAYSLAGKKTVELYRIGPFPTEQNTSQREQDNCFERIDAMSVPQLVAVLMQGYGDKWIAHAARTLRDRYIDKVAA